MFYRTMAFLTFTLVAVFAVTGHASEYSTGYARIASYEDSSSLTGQLTIDVWYHFRTLLGLEILPIFTPRIPHG